MKMKGFTLVEMVITLLVGSILVLGIAGFVELGARGYSDTIERQRLQTQAKFVLEKMSREIRHAVPNMFSDDLVLAGAQSCISFYPIETSGFYAVSGADLQFVVGSENSTLASLQNKSLVINPTQANPNNNVFALNAVKSVSDTYLLENVASSLVGESVSNRHYIYDPSGEVSYCIVGQRIQRIEDRSRVTPISDTGVAGDLTYQPASVQRSGVVHMQLSFTNERDDETTYFQQDVQVLNVP